MLKLRLQRYCFTSKGYEERRKSRTVHIYNSEIYTTSDAVFFDILLFSMKMFVYILDYIMGFWYLETPFYSLIDRVCVDTYQ